MPARRYKVVMPQNSSTRLGPDGHENWVPAGFEGTKKQCENWIRERTHYPNGGGLIPGGLQMKVVPRSE